MTLSNSSRSPNFNSTDLNVNTLMNNQEFQEILQEYFQSNTMTLDEFLENLPRFMMENYGLESNEENDELEESSDEDNEMFFEQNEENFLALLRRNRREYRTERQNDPTQLLFRSLLAGRREINEIPLRTILPQSPPPSPLPNIANLIGSNPILQRHLTTPQVPLRHNRLERRPSQLRNSTSNSGIFDPNVPEECKSPNTMPINILPFDRNNDMRYTSEFMSRYGRTEYLQTNPAVLTNAEPTITEEYPER